jgi:hypothetical protein
MITPPAHADEDPDMALRDVPAVGHELELADDAGMEPQDGIVGRSEAGGVPRADFHDHLADRTHTDQVGGHVGGDIGGASQETGVTGGYSGGDIRVNRTRLGVPATSAGVLMARVGVTSYLRGVTATQQSIRNRRRIRRTAGE